MRRDGPWSRMWGDVTSIWGHIWTVDTGEAGVDGEKHWEEEEWTSQWWWLGRGRDVKGLGRKRGELYLDRSSSAKDCLTIWMGRVSFDKRTSHPNITSSVWDACQPQSREFQKILTMIKVFKPPFAHSEKDSCYFHDCFCLRIWHPILCWMWTQDQG